MTTEQVPPSDKFCVNLSLWVDGRDKRQSTMDYMRTFVANSPIEFQTLHLSTFDDFEIESESDLRVEEELYYDENTINKVRAAIAKADNLRTPTQDQFLIDCIAEIQNAGILFRERKPE